MRSCFFASYEVPMGDHHTLHGQTALVHEFDDHDGLQPAVLLSRVQEQVAQQYGVWPAEVRIHTLTRLD